MYKMYYTFFVFNPQNNCECDVLLSPFHKERKHIQKGCSKLAMEKKVKTIIFLTSKLVFSMLL
jgi:hypothetical protein